MIPIPALSTKEATLELLGQVVSERLGKEVQAIDAIGKDELSRTFSVKLHEEDMIVARVASPHMPSIIIESEVATMKYIADRTTLPVPNILSYELDPKHPLGPFILMGKAPGVKLESIFDRLSQDTQDALVAQIARFMLELSHHHFSSIGSLQFLRTSPTPPSSPSPLVESFQIETSTVVGPLTHPSFYIDGRVSIPLDRGPFSTSRKYFEACAQRELDSSRALFTQGAPEAYQRELEDGQLLVERCVSLMHNIIPHCQTLDDGDAELAKYSLDLHELGLHRVFVNPDDPAQILSIVDWGSTTTRPLWRCARLPHWLSPSLLSDHPDTDQPKHRLSDVFRRTIMEAEGPESPYLRALDSDDVRHALDEVTEYDAFKDGFLVLPTLESILATLPGKEDVDGLKKLLDPKTLTGRAARISLMTHGSNALFLAMSPPPSPIQEMPSAAKFRRPIRYSLQPPT